MTKKIYGIGETVYDIIFKNDQPQRAVPGGSCFNSMISLGRCGLAPTMVTETGDDHVGRLITTFMESNGVRTDFVTVHPGTKTHISLAFLDDQNDAHYQFYKDHASARVIPHFPDFKEGDVVLFGSFFAVNPAIREFTREFLLRAHKAGCVIYYDINFRAAHIADLPTVMPNIEENMRLATIVRGSTEDFECLASLDPARQAEIKANPDAIYEWIRDYCPNLIVTAGGDGITTYFNGERQTFSVPPIETVSTIGAGDNFNAGAIYHIATHSLTREALAQADASVIAELVASAQSFSADVCQSLDNYVSPTFTQSLTNR